MKLVRFIPLQSYPRLPRLGALQQHVIVDLQQAYRLYLLEADICSPKAALRVSQQFLPSDTVQFLENGTFSMEAAKQAIAFAETFESREDEKITYEQHDVRLLAPIEKPRNLRDFISFEDHIKNSRKTRNKKVPDAWYKLPVYYKGNTATIIGPDDDVVWPNYTSLLDYELEFACIIGKQGIDISEENANDYIFGYTIMNDFSARDIQMQEMSVGLGPAKGKDFATALGPYIITKDELPDPYNLNMIARVNGEVWSEGNTKTMYRPFSKIVEHVSESELIVAGDVLGSGTVGFGCGLELGKFLKDGDVVELEIEKLGVLRNKIIKR